MRVVAHCAFYVGGDKGCKMSGETLEQKRERFFLLLRNVPVNLGHPESRQK